jgi:CRP-like cAMP-binding protein
MSPVSAHRICDFPLFARFEAVWTSLLPQIQVKSYAKDEMVAHHGMAAHSIWLVLSGWVSLARNTPDGRESIVGLCCAGDLFGEAGLFLHATYPYNAQVVQADTELAVIPAEVMRRMVETHPQFSQSIMQELNNRVATAQLKLEQMSTLSAAQRIGCFLLRLCQHQTGGARFITMPVEKHLVATYLGMKPETLSRGFQQLTTIGIRVNGSEIEIHDVAALREYVCGSCGESGLCATEEEVMATASGPRL